MFQIPIEVFQYEVNVVLYYRYFLYGKVSKYCYKALYIMLHIHLFQFKDHNLFKLCTNNSWLNVI